MDILIFDMDGVLVQSRGYHLALQETVRMAGDYLDLEGIALSQEDIHKFESLGVSSEWHSSALCMAFLELQLLSGTIPSILRLEELFQALEEEPVAYPVLQRSLAALERIAADCDADIQNITSRVHDSEDIERSLTMNWFQELVLGSPAYQERYQKPPQQNTFSYLEEYDIPLLSPQNAKRIASWTAAAGRGAAIMTNRPSAGPPGFAGSPEAELGRKLVGLEKIPLIGYGEITWLAESLQAEPGTLAKPNPAHALAAILGAAGLDKENSLTLSVIDPAQWPDPVKQKLDGGNIAVFEDTAGGIAAVCSAGESLRRSQIDVKLRFLGIAKGKTKKTALQSQGAEIFPDINTALEHFGPFARD